MPQPLGCQGDDLSKQRLSHGRAQATVELLRDKCAVLNVTRSIATGSTDLFDANALASKRVAEVWAVLRDDHSRSRTMTSPGGVGQGSRQ